MAKYNTLAIVKDLEKSGLTHKAYCLKKNIPSSTLAYHLRKHRRSPEISSKKQSEPSFFPVDLKATRIKRSRTLIVFKGEFSCDELIKIANAELS